MQKHISKSKCLKYIVCNVIRRNHTFRMEGAFLLPANGLANKNKVQENESTRICHGLWFNAKYSHLDKKTGENGSYWKGREWPLSLHIGAYGLQLKIHRNADLVPGSSKKEDSRFTREYIVFRNMFRDSFDSSYFYQTILYESPKIFRKHSLTSILPHRLGSRSKNHH